MNKFKVGDRVIRIFDSAKHLPVGSIGTITVVAKDGELSLKEYVPKNGGVFLDTNFKLYVPTTWKERLAND